MFVGTCPDMCPEKERFMRETRKQLSIFEVIPDTEMVISIKPFFYFQTEDYRVCFFFHLKQHHEMLRHVFGILRFLSDTF